MNKELKYINIAIVFQALLIIAYSILLPIVLDNEKISIDSINFEINVNNIFSLCIIAFVFVPLYKEIKSYKQEQSKQQTVNCDESVSLVIMYLFLNVIFSATDKSIFDDIFSILIFNINFFSLSFLAISTSVLFFVRINIKTNIQETSIRSVLKQKFYSYSIINIFSKYRRLKLELKKSTSKLKDFQEYYFMEREIQVFNRISFKMRFEKSYEKEERLNYLKKIKEKNSSLHIQNENGVSISIDREISIIENDIENLASDIKTSRTLRSNDKDRICNLKDKHTKLFFQKNDIEKDIEIFNTIILEILVFSLYVILTTYHLIAL